MIAPAADRTRPCTIAQHPSGPPLRDTAREAAVDEAGRFAQRQAIDVWMHQAFRWTRLSTDRRPASAAAAAPAAE